MKDLHMALEQSEILRAKAALDKALNIVGHLAGEAMEASLTCCGADLLDQRDQFADLAGHLRAAEANLIHARAAGGRIEGGGITRSGGT